MTIPDAAPPPSRGKDVLVEFPQDELIAKWEEFFEEMGYLSKIIAVADRYPESRSLEASFLDLNRFDTDMAIYLLRHPLNVLNAGEEAIRRLVPPGEEAALIHLRVRALPRDRRIPIRDLRAKHLGQYIAVEGLVRKSTEVRPRVTDALFQCLRRGTVLKEPQDGQNFREPLERNEVQAPHGDVPVPRHAEARDSGIAGRPPGRAGAAAAHAVRRGRSHRPHHTGRADRNERDSTERPEGEARI